MVTNGIVAQDAAQADALWAVRERITEALQHDGTVYKYDISLPLPQLYSLVCFLWCAHLFVCAFVCVHVRVCLCLKPPSLCFVRLLLTGALQVEEMRTRVNGVATSCVGYGHVGDGECLRVCLRVCLCVCVCVCVCV